MKKFLVCILVLTAVSTSHAQMGKPKWIFNSRAQVISVLKGSRGKLPQSYDAIVCATRQGFGSSAIKFYEDLVLGHEFSANAADSASLAFAFDLNGRFRTWNWKHEIAPVKVNITDAQVVYFRERAFELLPANPQVLVMRAWSRIYGQREERKEAYECAIKAVRIAPNWADAQFTLGVASNYFGIAFRADKYPLSTDKKIQATRSRLGRCAMEAFDKAQRLDPVLGKETYLARLTSCELIGDRKSADLIPKYVDAQLRAFPNYSAWLEKRWNENEQQFRQNYDQIASVIRKGI